MNRSPTRVFWKVILASGVRNWDNEANIEHLLGFVFSFPLQVFGMESRDI